MVGSGKTARVKAAILSIGDELILGQTVDSNSAWLSARLSDLGILSLYHKTVADDLPAISSALEEACRLAGLVVVTGGLGPTADDLTRQALAEMLGRPLDLHPPSLERIKAFFKSINRPMPASNRIQAMVPRGCDVLDNLWGTAPGIRTVCGKAQVFVFPGVPDEMMRMSERYIFPLFQKGGSGLVVAVESVQTFGAGESVVAERLGDLMRRDRNPLVGTTVSGGVVTVRLRSESPSATLARKQLDATIRAVEDQLGELVFGHGDTTLPSALGLLLKARGLSVATAESCTGGLVARMLTEVPGASQWYPGGWVTYSNAMKTRELGVDASLIAQEGAVSEGVARAMAAGALKESGAECAIALTGIAGPEGGSAEKPVGTVWIAVGVTSPGGGEITASRFQFHGGRASIRDRAAKTAINLLRLALISR